MTKEVMNKQIRQLLNEATVGLEPELSTHTTITHNELSKFAELIVRECMKAADEGMAQVTMKVEWPSYHIKKHFGVEK